MIKCKSCGKENGENVWKCETCNFPLHDEPRPLAEKKKPKNYIIPSVLLILSCIPTALVSFFYGMKVNSSFLNGNYTEAETYTQKAKIWIRISAGIAIVIIIIFMMYIAKLYNQMGPMMDKEIQRLLRE